MRAVSLISLAPLLFIVGCNGQSKEDVSEAVNNTAQVTTEPVKSDTVQRGPEPDWADASELLPKPENQTGLIFLRRNDTAVHLNKKGQSTYTNQRISLLDSRALEVGNLSLVWNPETGSPVLHKLLVHRDGEVIDVLKDNSFEVVRQEDQLEQSMLNGFLTAILRVPDLRVGDELEWAYTTPSHDLTLGDKSYGMISLAAAIQSGAYKASIIWDEGQKPNLQTTDDLKDSLTKTANSISITLNNAEIITPAKEAPLRYSWQRILEYSDFETWPAVSKKFHTFYDDASKFSQSSNLIDEVKRIAKNNPQDIDRIKSALKLVQQQVRYIYVGLNGGNIRAATAEETWKRRYGDCKGKAALLLALLRELNIEAELILVNNSGTDDGFDARLPNPLLFDHVILRAQIDGQNYWLDPTLPAIIEPSLNPIIPYRWILPLSSKGETLQSVENAAFELPHDMGITEYDAREGFDKPARKKRIMVKRGVEGLAEYMQYSALTAEQLKTGYKNALTGSDAWNVVEDVTYRYDTDSQASILTIKGTGPVDWEKKSRGIYTLTLPGGGFSPPSRRQRSEGEYGDIPFYSKRSYSCHVTTVRLPDATKLKNWGYNTTYQNEIFGRRYYRMMERHDDRSIRMVRSSRVEDQEITTQKATHDNERISNFDNSMAIIEYNPNKVMIPWGNQKPVPATYDMDWTGSDVPCQPAIISPESRAVSRQNTLEAEAKTGDVSAQYKLGKFLQKGQIYNTPEDALEWLEKAAEQGHKKANFELGRHYALQETDLKKAAKYLKTSEDKKEGIFLLADIYFRNPELFPDISDARIMELYRLSSDNDSLHAHRALAQRYKDGSMIKRDEVEALKWAFIANGFDTGSNFRFKSDLSEKEVNEARNRAQEWINTFRTGE
ncbi:DUF3857 domain-containing protein [Hellea balneolensis]|uniref:DUF3857 domain-containing protein n=1 Tax=Hellea balneolensis TaxID=287478 RepID=UPI0003F73F7D|nr:DUF3857 domain-containing protein [Hellea balneolensis]